jgi:Tfp pilus assembly protein PilF
MRGDDPVEVRVYYQDYRTGNYAAVLAAGDSAVKRAGPRGLLVRDYMRLYVGLSYLATGDGRNAVSELGDVVFRTKPGDVLYETAQWYLALAWLKRNDVEAAEAKNKALELAREIAHSYSRYREPAMELVRALKQ